MTIYAVHWDSLRIIHDFTWKTFWFTVSNQNYSSHVAYTHVILFEFLYNQCLLCYNKVVEMFQNVCFSKLFEKESMYIGLVAVSNPFAVKIVNIINCVNFLFWECW